MCMRATTTVRIGKGNTIAFEICVGVHQGSCLSPLLFITDHCRWSDCSWTVICFFSKLQERFGKCKKALESKGLKMNVNKTETICAKIQEPLSLIEMERFWSRWKISDIWDQYFMPLVNVKRTSKPESQQHGKSGVNCHECCVTWMFIAVKGKVYKTMVRPVMIYGAEAWPWEKVKTGFLKELKWECSDGCLVSHGSTGKEMMTFSMPLESLA